MSDWVKVNFGQLFDIIYRYPTYYGIEYVEQGVPEIRGELLTSNGKIVDNYRYITPQDANRFPKVWLKKNDFIMSVRGTVGKVGLANENHTNAVITANLLRLSPNSLCRRGLINETEKIQYAVLENNILITRVFATVDGVGLPTLVPQMHEQAVFESNMMRLRVDDTKVEPLILFEWLRSSKVRKQIVSNANASNQVSINQTALNALPVPFIGVCEQKKMVNTIVLHTQKYIEEKTSLKKLIQQKSGLMNDLLTGKVSVNVDSDAP